MSSPVPTPVPAAPNAATGRCLFGLYEFDVRTGELRREGRVIKLSPQPSRVLGLLLARPGEVILREDIRKDVWGEDTFVDFERGLNFCILQVRTALGDSSDNPRFVQTVPRKGYRFIAPVAYTSAASPAHPATVNRSSGGLSPFPVVATDGRSDQSSDLSSCFQEQPASVSASPAAHVAVPAEPAEDLPGNASSRGQSRVTVVAEAIGQGQSTAFELDSSRAETSLPLPTATPAQTAQNLRSNRSYRGQSPVTGVAPAATRRRSSGFLVAAAVSVLVGVSAWLVFRSTTTDTAPPAPPTVRVAILPFVNLSGDRGADYLADGLTDELISQLGQLSADSLAVIARTSAMTYRNTTKTVGEIGRELNVSFVVESSLRREGDGLRIASRLVPVADQAPIAEWSERFGGAATTANESQSSVAIRLARLIAIELTPDAPASSVPRPTSSLTAWDAFLQGRALANRGTAEDNRRAIAQFEAAVQRDPNFAAAWAKLVESRHVLVMMGALPPRDAYPAARAEAQRALSADSTLADAHLARGLVQLWYDWKAADAAKSFEHALALNGSHAPAHHDYAWSLLALGRTAEAITHITTARDLDPLSVRANNDIGWLHLQLRQPTEAAKACQQTLAIQPNSLEAQACLERAHAQRGLYDAALGAARAGLPPAGRALASTDSQPTAEALRAVWRWRLERLEQASRTRWVSPYTLAVQHALVGNVEAALDHLEAAFEQKVGMMVFLHRDPGVDKLRKHPRFVALVNRLNEAAQ